MKTLRSFFILAAALVSQNALAEPTVTTAISTGLFEPFGVAVDTNNDYYLTDGTHQVFKYTSSLGTLVSLAGARFQYGDADGPGFLARFWAPKGIVWYDGGLVVADSGNHTLRKISLGKSVATVITFAGASGQTKRLFDGPLSSPNVNFNAPAGLAVDGSNNLYVADAKNNAIRKISPDPLVPGSFLIRTIASDLFEPTAMSAAPDGVVYVADTRGHAIRVLTPQADGTYAKSLLAGSPLQISGYQDDYFSTNSLLSSPSGVLWVGGDLGLLVSDSGNHALRRIYQDDDLNAYFGTTDLWTVATYSGSPSEAGLMDGGISVARFSSPGTLVRDQRGDLLVMDGGSQTLRRIQITTPKPRMPDPVIGFVTWVTNDLNVRISKLVAFDDLISYTEQAIIAIKGEPESISFTAGPTPALFAPDTIPDPVPNVSAGPPPYKDGMTEGEVPPSMLSPQPDITIKAVSSAEGRQPSNIVKARVQFKVSKPVIMGDNPVSFQVKLSTEEAEIFYTVDGSEPTNSYATNVFGPKTSGETFSLTDSSTLALLNKGPVKFRARAFKLHFQPSDLVSQDFSLTNFAANRISLGFAVGEASSAFVGAAGQRFFAPVTLSLLPGQQMYGLQFNLTVTNISAAPRVQSDGESFRFNTMLLKPIPNSNPLVFTHIANEFIDDLTKQEWSMMFTNFDINLLGVGWMEQAAKTNLYDATKQDLITYSQAHDTLFESAKGKVILGAYSFLIPPSAAFQQGYELRVARPSATADGYSADVFIDAPTNGSLTLGPINSIKQLTVRNPGYLVGDVAPFRWFNAGDFGDNNLLNNDVMQIFRSAVNLMNYPPLDCDMLAAMDASSGSTNGYLIDASNDTINHIWLGDTNLNVDDLYVTFRRSLDPTLFNVMRYWSNGTATNIVLVPNLFRGQLASQKPPRTSGRAADLPAEAALISTSTETPGVTFWLDDSRVQPGQKVRVPLRARIAGQYPIRVCMFGFAVQALEGAPPLTQPVGFVPAAGLGQPTFSDASGPSIFAGAWLNNAVSGVWGNTELGTMEITLPANAPATAAYRITFSHISASPNGLGLLPKQITDGLLTVSDRSASSWGDGIPDSWRLRYFGSLSNLLSARDADADGDGAPNWAEYKAGTNPTDIKSCLRLQVAGSNQAGSPRRPLLSWPTTLGKTYLVEFATSILEPLWMPMATGIQGTGALVQFSDPDPGSAPRFYRVRVDDDQTLF